MRAKSSLQLEAYNYIKNLILTDQLDVDKMYSETKLSKEIGVSRTPMREALQCLSQMDISLYFLVKAFRLDSLIKRI